MDLYRYRTDKINKKSHIGLSTSTTNCSSINVPTPKRMRNRNGNLNRTKTKDKSGDRYDRWRVTTRKQWGNSLRRGVSKITHFIHNKMKMVRRNQAHGESSTDWRLVAVYRKISQKRRRYKKGMHWRRGRGHMNSCHAPWVERTRGWIHGPKPMPNKYQRRHKKVTEKAK